MATPVDSQGRIQALDVIRGFALFGVLWMNLYEHPGFLLPEDKVIPLAPEWLEAGVSFVSRWLMIGKAQMLFSLLFGFGFALFLSRAQAAGRSGTRLYLRRAGFLLVLGIAHATLLWAGDILNAYGMMAFVLVLTQRWRSRWLLATGLALTLLGVVSVRLFYTYGLHVAPNWNALQEATAAAALPVLGGHDYGAYVRLLVRSGRELYSTGIGAAYLGWIFGRFLIGTWLFRQGWLQQPERHVAGFRRWATILLGIGLPLALVGPVLGALQIKLTSEWVRIPLNVLGAQLSTLLLALGYAAAIVVLCQSPRWAARLSGLGAAGRMALTNYLTQSLLYFFLLYGFGFGLLRYTGPVFCLAVAIVFFAAQIAFSRWWLARYRFGPAEWVWRSWTYGQRPPMRSAPLTETPALA